MTKLLKNNHYDIIVVGGGHAGTEAALAASRAGMQTLLVTHNLETIGQMSCNPSIGGIGKSHLVKEIDALGGAMAEAIDVSGIQFRVLNKSKGPAVRATRAQADRVLYKQAILNHLEKQPNLQLLQQTIDDFIIENNCVKGVITHLGVKLYARAIILAVGTFLNGKIHVGLKSYSGGRAGDPAAISLANALKKLPLRERRLKTGTPPRIDGKSIDYSQLIEQKGDEPIPVFSYLGKREQHPQQISCYIAHTNEKTHEIIRNNLDKSPLYTGIIAGTGPRYCPSIEDKITRFADKSSHQVFIEREGLTTFEVYPNGISTSLPFEAQWELVRSMKGFENAQLTRAGYAIEYDFFDSRDLKFSLETKEIKGLFLAGQINGTTGYEEAAAQGLIAGINAALYVKNEEAWWPRRDEAYIGVMLEDLIIKGTEEPYRMFTSRAEYRLLLREDNADQRLSEIGRKLGVVDDRRWQLFNVKCEAIKRESERLKNIVVRPNSEHGRAVYNMLQKPLEREYNAFELLQRSDINFKELMQIVGIEIGTSPELYEIIEQIDIQQKYACYIARQLEEIKRHRRHEETKLPQDFDYDLVLGLSNEVRQKLNAVKPVTIGQASRISGITPAAISILLVYLKKYKNNIK